MTHGFWNVASVAHALHSPVQDSSSGHSHGNAEFAGISTDTRTIRAGDLFVALAGERYDAHDYLREAIAAGAHGVVVSRASAAEGLEVPVFVVHDTLVALGDLARFHRLAWGGPVVAVAGSNGKTSTKELLRAALESSMTVHATTGNLNNRVGVPITLLALPTDADVAVIELGTSIPGEIAMLRDIARPDIAIVTSIAEEHLEGFGDIAGVLKEEASVFHGVTTGIIPAGDAELAAAASSVRKLVRAGLDEGEFAATVWKLEADGTGMVNVDGSQIRSPMRGMHNLRNLMLALAAARELDVPMAEAAVGLARMTPPPMRANWQNIGKALVINDAYNANPGSAMAAIEMLAVAPGTQKVAMLGSMLELGSESDNCHDRVSLAALASTVDLVAGMGTFAASLRRVASGDERVIIAEDVNELWQLLVPRLRADATILLKASRGARLERILPLISSWSNPEC